MLPKKFWFCMRIFTRYTEILEAPKTASDLKHMLKVTPFICIYHLGALFCKFMYSVVGFTVLVSLTLLLVMILVLGIGINF